MNVIEAQAIIDIQNVDFSEAKATLEALANEAFAASTEKAVPKTVVIGNSTLFDFLYLISTDVSLYGETATVYLKYLKVDR
jgi:hypothetical protein